LVADARATTEQRDAITAIASGAAGGPMAALSGLISTFLGVQPAPIVFTRQGVTWSVTSANFVDMAATGAKGLNPDRELRLENTGHPAADTFTSPTPQRVMHAFGLIGMIQREEQRPVCAVLVEEYSQHGVGASAKAHTAG
jgi:hypothetical protein